MLKKICCCLVSNVVYKPNRACRNIYYQYNSINLPIPKFCLLETCLYIHIWYVFMIFWLCWNTFFWKEHFIVRQYWKFITFPMTDFTLQLILSMPTIDFSRINLYLYTQRYKLPLDCRRIYDKSFMYVLSGLGWITTVGVVVASSST